MSDQLAVSILDTGSLCRKGLSSITLWQLFSATGYGCAEPWRSGSLQVYYCRLVGTSHGLDALAVLVLGTGVILHFAYRMFSDISLQGVRLAGAL